MADNSDWTLAIGCRKAAVQIAIRLPLAIAVCWGGFWLLRKFIAWMEGEIHQEITNIGWGLVLVIGLGAGVIAGQILSRKLSEGTGLFGNHLLLPTCVPLVAGLWCLQQIVGSTDAGWTQVSFWLFAVTGIAACIMAWWQFGLDS
ncbi:MAG: hypothetical protein QGH60_01460 [Phycisphaerae bacterium]|jgi:hypothetical protein|nr:hypothetical protein [Phycisphaerae bacterium]